jgi:DNA-binding LytR/AlgR family response regulator
MNVLIIEDEEQTAERLEDLLHKYDRSVKVLAHLPSVSKSLAYFRDRKSVRPDLIFLDIHLEDDLGFRIPEELQLTIPIIFTTAYNEYAMRAFKSFSIDYLLKPIDYDELRDAMVKFRKISVSGFTPDIYQQLSGNFPKAAFKERFMVSAGPRLQSIPVSQIAYFFYDQRAAFLTTNDDRHFSIDYSLDKLIEVLDPNQFFRVNRSFIISVSSINSIDTYSLGKLKVDLRPKARQEVFVSIDRITLFKAWLGK